MEKNVVSIIGSGPAALFAARELLAATSDIYVDMYDRLPVIGGLARYGIAPDHYTRRSIVSQLATEISATGRFSFFGGVEVGNDVSHEAMISSYNAVIYACGCSEEKKLGIPGENLAGVYSASEFVNWYNGHPDHFGAKFNLNHKKVVVIGAGNVSLDVARILLLNDDALRRTDMSADAIEALSQSKVNQVTIIARRGPLDTSFTTPELLEIGEMEGIKIDIELPENMAIDDLNLADFSGDKVASYTKKLKLDIFREFSRRPKTDGKKRLKFKFYSSPKEFFGEHSLASVITKSMAKGEQGPNRAREDAGIAFKAIGYRGKKVPYLPMDKSSAVTHQQGRVYDPLSDEVLNGVYVVGWQKRGASGGLGMNKACAIETVKSLINDAHQKSRGDFSSRRANLIKELQSNIIGCTSYTDWRRIENSELAMASETGAPRKKLINYADMLKLVKSR